MAQPSREITAKGYLVLLALQIKRNYVSYKFLKNINIVRKFQYQIFMLL